MDSDTAIRYAWNSDNRYYATVVDNYYRQLPLYLRLRSQALILWVVLSSFMILPDDLTFRARCTGIAVVSAFALAFGALVKRGIMLKYKLRPTFGAETTFTMNNMEVAITGPGAGTFPWNVYQRATRFSDGLLLSRQGGIRWLPDTALKQGTLNEAIEMVRKHLPTRDVH